MPFPSSPRVLYEKNPLDRVICQLRFPAILKIDAELPAQFQERIREEFPNFTEGSELRIQLPSEIRDRIPPEILGQMVGSSTGKNYEFSSQEGEWKVNLTRSHIALDCRRYTRWEKFKEKLMIPFAALTNVYSPRFMTRIGLRYIDIIKRSNLGLEGVAWRELLQPYVAGLLSSSDIEDEVKGFENVWDLALPDGISRARIIARLVSAKEGGELCFMLDSDFSVSGQTSIEEATNKLDFFNVQASRLIQWAITGRLKEAMRPITI